MTKMNLAFFDPAVVRCGTVTQYRLTSVSVDIALDGV
jgi:hypothetical protein